ncbi:MAG: transcription antitermination factor NusB [Candidatus Cloacimonetes bacterium]|nr:transcription antitermination factor NusB [Candidatus Cloacimonadota bacterium]
MGLRRESREIAVQTLYALYLTPECLETSAKIPALINEKLAQVIAFNDKALSNSQKEFSYFLIENTYNHLGTIDDLIKQFSEHWDFNRIAILDKGILRMSIMEMEFTETDSKIIINEAIEIAKKFSGEKSGKFINGILDAVMHRKDKNDKV